MSLHRIICSIVLLTALTCIHTAPNNSKESAHDNESESISHEAESKEISDESAEVDSEYQDKESKPDTENNNHSRDDLLRPLPLPETYGIPGVGNPDMIPLAHILAESVKYVQQRSDPKKSHSVVNS